MTLSAILLILSFTAAKTKPEHKTICNPINLSYRFSLDKPSRREAADPVIVLFKNEYYLFASKSGGYWHSTDMADWDFITSAELPFEDYAPAVVAIGDTLYFMASGNAPVSIFKTADPKSGNWKIVNSAFPISMTDPDLFLDDDGRLYFYYGCSNNAPIHAVELDRGTLNPKGKPVDCFNSNSIKYGWEQTGDNNNNTDRPWIEGSWMTKHNGKYYLQYAVPGTQYKSYCDGVYVADNPLGPFKVALHNPFSYKPAGFINGAGHSCTFQDKYGNYWHITTMTISQKHMFERRLGLFPVFFDSDGTFYTYTGFGDFPFSIPDRKINGPDELFPQWMLLSYKKPVEVSSELQGYPKDQAVDEEIRTSWSAQTGNKGEWISIDLGKESVVNAIQVNFAENQAQLYDRNPKIYYQYLLEYSDDNKIWKLLVDKTTNRTDIPHDYIQLKTPVRTRYIRLTNYHVPDGTFAISGFRIFGNGQGNKPEAVRNFNVIRKSTDRREVKIMWDKESDAVGFNIRYGTRADKLYNNWEVLGADSLIIRSLNSDLKYYFSIDSFNENGVTKGKKVVVIN